MKEQQSGQTDTKLQPLVFEPFSASGHATAYRAVIKDDKAPGSPVYALTVTIASPIFHVAKKDFLVFLSKMTASFRLLARLDPSGSEPDDELSDIGTQIQIEASLVSITGPDPAGVAVTVRTSIGPSDHVGPHNNNHYWITKSKSSYNDATVTPSSGNGEIWAPKGKSIYVDRFKKGQLKASKVNVHSDQGMDYNFDGNFYGPYDP